MDFLANPPCVPLFWRAPSNQRPHLIDPVAFFAALILGPIVITALTFYLLIPVFALAVGAPTYLSFGALFFWFSLSWGWDRIPQIIGMGFLANLASAPAMFGFLLAFRHTDAAGATLLIVGMGCIFAPLWSAAFAALYRWLRLEFYQS